MTIVKASHHQSFFQTCIPSSHGCVVICPAWRDNCMSSCCKSKPTLPQHMLQGPQLAGASLALAAQVCTPN